MGGGMALNPLIAEDSLPLPLTWSAKGGTPRGVVQDGFRHVEGLVDEGRPAAGLKGELGGYPLDQRVELSRYAWGLLDRRCDPDREAALWLYAWALAAEQEERGVEVSIPQPVE